MDSPFNNLSDSQIGKLSSLLGTHSYKFKKNEKILPTIRSNSMIGIIIDGTAQIIYNEYNGNEIVLETLKKDSVFGNNISSINSENCEIIAKQNTEILVIEYNTLTNPKNLKYSYFNTFLANLFDIINTKFKEQNERINILERKQIREKLLEYFKTEYRKSHSKSIRLPFSLKDLADYIAVNRSAMFRELKHLKEEKFIDIKNKKITLLYV